MRFGLLQAFGLCGLALAAQSSITLERTPHALMVERAAFIAIEVGAVSEFCRLLEQMTDKNSYDESGNTLLQCAIVHAQLEMVECLLQFADVDIDRKALHSGMTAVHLAAERDDAEILEVLLQRSPMLDEQDNAGSTALYLATRWNRLENVQLLLGKGAGVNVYKSPAHSALYEAVFTGRAEIVRCLLKHGPKMDELYYPDYTLLHVAAEGGHVSVAEQIIDYEEAQSGSNQSSLLNREDGCGAVPLHFAAEYGHLSVVQLLVRKHANINATKYMGETALHLASQNGHGAIVKYLLEMNAVRNQHDYFGLPFHYAARAGLFEVVKLMVDMDKDLITASDATNSDWRMQSAPLVFEKTTEESIALHLAAQSGNLDLVKFLFALNPAVNARDASDETPLHYAAANGHLSVVQFLVENDADVDAINRANQTAQCFALRKQHYHVAMFLKGSGGTTENVTYSMYSEEPDYDLF